MSCPSYYCVNGKCYKMYIKCDIQANPFCNVSEEYEKIEETEYHDHLGTVRQVNTNLGRLCDAVNICIYPNVPALREVSKWSKRIGYVLSGTDVALKVFDEGGSVVGKKTLEAIGGLAAEKIGGKIGEAIGDALLPGIGTEIGRFLGSMMGSLIYDRIVSCFFGVKEFATQEITTQNREEGEGGWGWGSIALMITGGAFLLIGAVVGLSKRR